MKFLHSRIQFEMRAPKYAFTIGCRRGILERQPIVIVAEGFQHCMHAPLVSSGTIVTKVELPYNAGTKSFSSHKGFSLDKTSDQIENELTVKKTIHNVASKLGSKGFWVSGSSLGSPVPKEATKVPASSVVQQGGVP